MTLQSVTHIPLAIGTLGWRTLTAPVANHGSPPMAPFVIVNGEPRPTSITPVYEQIKQTSIDLQAIIGSWLWKLEAINRSGQGDTFRFCCRWF